MDAQELRKAKMAAMLAYASSSPDAAKVAIVSLRLEEQATIAESKGNFAQADFFRNNCPISLSYLRQEIALQDSKTSYEFTFLEDQNAPAYEQRLQQNDIFYITDVCVGVTRRVTARPSAGFRYQYADPFVFSEAGESEGINAIFQGGKLSATFNNNLIIPSLDLDRFRSAKQAQAVAGTPPAVVPYAVTTAAPVQTLPVSWDNKDGFIEMAQIPVLSGKNTNRFVVSIPSYSGIQLESETDTFNALSLYLRGFLVSGAARALTV
jgi:hypothetical protein